MYQIRGYDSIWDQFYWLPELYEEYEAALKRCRTREIPIKVSA